MSRMFRSLLCLCVSLALVLSTIAPAFAVEFDNTGSTEDDMFVDSLPPISDSGDIQFNAIVDENENSEDIFYNDNILNEPADNKDIFSEEVTEFDYTEDNTIGIDGEYNSGDTEVSPSYKNYNFLNPEDMFVKTQNIFATGVTDSGNANVSTADFEIQMRWADQSNIENNVKTINLGYTSTSIITYTVNVSVNGYTSTRNINIELPKYIDCDSIRFDYGVETRACSFYTVSCPSGWSTSKGSDVITLYNVDEIQGGSNFSFTVNYRLTSSIYIDQLEVIEVPMKCRLNDTVHSLNLNMKLDRNWYSYARDTGRKDPLNVVKNYALESPICINSYSKWLDDAFGLKEDNFDFTNYIYDVEILEVGKYGAIADLYLEVSPVFVDITGSYGNHAEIAGAVFAPRGSSKYSPIQATKIDFIDRWGYGQKSKYCDGQYNSYRIHIDKFMSMRDNYIMLLCKYPKDKYSVYKNGSFTNQAKLNLYLSFHSYAVDIYGREKAIRLQDARLLKTGSLYSTGMRSTVYDLNCHGPRDVVSDIQLLNGKLLNDISLTKFILLLYGCNFKTFSSAEYSCYNTQRSDYDASNPKSYTLGFISGHPHLKFTPKTGCLDTDDYYIESIKLALIDNPCNAYWFEQNFTATLDSDDYDKMCYTNQIKAKDKVSLLLYSGDKYIDSIELKYEDVCKVDYTNGYNQCLTQVSIDIPRYADNITEVRVIYYNSQYVTKAYLTTNYVFLGNGSTGKLLQLTDIFRPYEGLQPMLEFSFPYIAYTDDNVAVRLYFQAGCDTLKDRYPGYGNGITPECDIHDWYGSGCLNTPYSIFTGSLRDNNNNVSFGDNIIQNDFVKYISLDIAAVAMPASVLDSEDILLNKEFKQRYCDINFGDWTKVRYYIIVPNSISLELNNQYELLDINRYFYIVRGSTRFRYNLLANAKALLITVYGSFMESCIDLLWEEIGINNIILAGRYSETEVNRTDLVNSTSINKYNVYTLDSFVDRDFEASGFMSVSEHIGFGSPISVRFVDSVSDNITRSNFNVIVAAQFLDENDNVINIERYLPSYRKISDVTGYTTFDDIIGGDGVDKYLLCTEFPINIVPTSTTTFQYLNVNGSKGINIEPEETYNYTLTYGVGTGTSTEVVLFDSIENSSRTGKLSEWNGEIQSIDLHNCGGQLYVSSVEIDANEYQSGNADKTWLTEDKGWTLVTDPQNYDYSNVKAIAVDASHKSWKAGEVVKVTIQMKAPVAPSDMEEGRLVTAYNESFFHDKHSSTDYSRTTIADNVTVTFGIPVEEASPVDRLPDTGGVGTNVYILFGISLLYISYILIDIKKRTSGY